MSSAAERQKRYRQRKRLGLKSRRVYLDPYQERLLIEAGMIQPEALDDCDLFADQLGDALEMLLSRNANAERVRDTGDK